MDYSLFEVFNSAEETINFGARNVEDDNLYETYTLSTFSVPIDEEDTLSVDYSAELNIRSSVKNEQLILAINNRIFVLTDLLCSTLCFEQKFDSIIDCISVTDNAKIILLCHRNGSVSLIDLEYGRYDNIEVNENLVASKSFFIEAFLEQASGDVLSFMVVNSAGIISRVTVNRNKDSLNIISEQLTNLYSEVKIAAYSNNSKTFLLSGKDLISYNIQKNIEHRDAPWPVKSCQVYNKHKFIALLENGEVCLISNSLFVTKVLPDRVFKSVEYFHTQNGNFMVCISKTTKSGKSIYELIKFPDYSSHFELNLSGDIYLIRPNNINDDYLYVYNEANGCLRICKIYETNPAQRLQRLLQKGKCNEAEAIAVKFNLSKSEIYKARINLMCDDLLDKSNMTILLDFLDKIGDVGFKLEVCLTASEICEEFSDVQRILEYGCNLELSKEQRYSDVEYQQDNVIEKLYLFETYMELKKLVECETFDMRGWINFIQINMVIEVQNRLNNHNFEEAILLYSRFEKKEFEQLTDKDIKKMLHSISSVPLAQARPFLCTFIPITLHRKPSALALIVRWARQCIQAMENSQFDHQEFPESAIDLIGTILGLLKTMYENSAGSAVHMVNLSNLVNGEEKDGDWHAVEIEDGSPVELKSLLEMLKSVRVLRDEFDVRLPLSVYIQNNRSLIHSFLTVPMEAENYKVFLKEFVIPYILKNNMNPDQVFLNEMKGVLAYEEKHWIGIVPAIVGSFKSVTLKLETILLILGGVKPPWNDTIRLLVQRTVASASADHPLVVQIGQCVIDEPIQIVLSKQEYCIPKTANLADHVTFSKIVERIIYCMIENNTNHENDIYTLCATTQKRDNANLIFAENFINHGNVDKALTYVDAISSEEKVRSCDKLLSLAMNKISAGWFTDPYKPFWFEVFEPLMNRLEALMEPFIFRTHIPRYIKIRTLSLIKKYFPESEITLKDVNKSKSIENEQFLTTFLTAKFLENAQSQEKLRELIKISLRIATTLLIDDCYKRKTEIDFLLSICEECKNLTVIVAIADFIYDSNVPTTSSKTLSLISILLMRNVGVEQQSCNASILSPNATIQNLSFCPLEEGSVDADVEVNLRALELALLLSELSAIMDDNVENRARNDEVFFWAMCMFDLVRSLDQSRSGHRAEMPNMNTFNTIRQLTMLYCGIVADFNNPNMEHLSHYTKEAEVCSLDGSSLQVFNLPMYIQHFSVDRHYFTALRVLGAFKTCLPYATKSVKSNFLEVLNGLSKKVGEQVLNSILTEDQIDTDMAFIHLTQLDSTYSAKIVGEYLRMYRKNYPKLSQIADLGLRLSTFFTSLTRLRATSITIKLRAKWIVALKTPLSTHEFFMSTPDRLIVTLIAVGCFAKVKTLAAFCADFGLPVADYFEVYIQRTLLSWKPEYSKGIIVNGAKAEELYERCMEVGRIYEGDLFGIINNLWGSINWYYYEVFLVIIRILETLSPDCLREKTNQKTLLHFLLEYRRVSKPGESELEEFFKRFPEAHTAEPLSEWRLPFTLAFFSTNIMKILKSEINLNTYKRWFDAIEALEGHLTKDYVCCYVIRSVVSSGALQVDKSHDWMLFSVRSDLFDEINECVIHIGNLEMATGALYHLTIHTPPGADQVRAAELCYTYALKLRESTEETADNANKFEKVKTKYYGSRVNQILHTYQLASDACFQLIADPNALIETIYMDPRILLTSDSTVSSCPDINEAASEIAKLYDMDIIEKQKSLVEAWLFDTNISYADDTMRVVFNNGITSNTQENLKDKFRRACYIFSSENITYWQEYLVEIGMNDEQNAKMGSHLAKARSLKCLYTISSIETVELLVEVSYAGLKLYFDKLFLLSDMERLGYNISMDKLDNMNKIRLLKELTRHLDKNTTRIMASICTIYFISDLKCWEFIINNFIKFEQFNDLKEAVTYLKDIHSFKYKKFYINAWQCVLNHEISRLRYNTTGPIDQNFVDLILMTQQCPISSKLNYSAIVEKFIQLDWWEFVAIFMQFLDYASSKEVSDLIDKIKSHSPGIVNRLNNEYSCHGILVLKIKRMLNTTQGQIYTSLVENTSSFRHLKVCPTNF